MSPPKPRLVLVKPPEESRFNFGAFSLGVLAAAVRHLADITIIDATALTLDEAVDRALAPCAETIGVTVSSLPSVGPAAAFLRRLAGQKSTAAARDARGPIAEIGATPVAGRGARPIAGNRATLIAGGHGAAMVPQALLSAGAAVVVLGEGERTLEQILQEGVVPGMPGTACRRDGDLVLGPPRPPIRPLDALPPPARDLTPPPADGIHLLETSRGCPHACAFCETTRFYGRAWRPRSPRRVAAEVRRLVEDYDAWTIQFADDNFAADPRRVVRTCDLLRRGPLPACILASARADDLVSHAGLIPAMAAARILRVSVGVETLDPSTAAAAGKPIAPEVYREAFSRLRRHDIFSVASFIVGLPGESAAARERAVELAVAAGPDAAQFLPCLPLPGTPIAARHPGSHPRCGHDAAAAVDPDGGPDIGAVPATVSPDPDPADLADARRFTAAFYDHPTVRARLEEAAAGGGIRGAAAAGTLARYGRSTNSV